jgi:long-subunit fatty acid transport protein
MPPRGLPIALVVAALAAGPARAGGFGIPEIGVRRTAMGAVIGRPDEGAAIYHNPAGLVLQRGWRLYLSMGLSLVRSEFQLRPWAESDRFLGTTPGADGYYAPLRPSRSMGAIPILAASGEILPGKLVLGAALYVGNAQGAAFDPDAVTRYHLIDGYVVAPQAMLAAAYRIGDALTVGGSAGVLDVRIHGKREVFPIINGMDVVGIFLVRELETIKNYHDSWQTSGGVRVHDIAALPGLELMAGTHFDRTPAPSSTVTLDQPTFKHIGLHTGVRWTAGRYRLGASYIRYWYLIPTVTDSTTSPPSNFRGNGSNHIFTASIEATL